jgi:hypothetical protein
VTNRRKIIQTPKAAGKVTAAEKVKPEREDREITTKTAATHSLLSHLR